MSDITIRHARATDAKAIDRLAALDSRPVPAGELLVAEVDGEIVAALSDGGTIADPFRRTADAVELLRVRSDTGRHRAHAGRRRRRPHTRLRLA